MINEKFVFLGIAIGLIGEIRYIWSTIHGQTRPNRVSWALWGIAPLVAFAGSLHEGAGLSSLMTLAVGIGPISVLIASYVNPDAYWKITRLDIVCGVLSVAGLALFVITKNGTVAVAAGVAADALAGIPTLVKAFRYPDTEHPLIFWLGAVNGGIATLTVSSWTFATAAFPIYLCLIAALLASIIQFRVGERVMAFTQR